MKQRVESFRKKSVSAAYVTLSCDAECNETKTDVLEGKYRLVLFCTTVSILPKQ